MTLYLNDQNKDLLEVAKQNKEKYQNAAPFPSISFDNFFSPTALEKVLAEFPDFSKEDSIKFKDQNGIKLAGKGERFFGEETKKFMHFLNSEPFLIFLQELTGIEKPLISDPYFVGGGQHEIKKGGFLKIHADFNRHAKLDLDRRLNVLVYLNKDWSEDYGGHFELWDKDMQACVNRISPNFNTMAIFSTTDFSYHGHPNPLNCPDGMSRKSLALYYYSNGRPDHEVIQGQENHTTIYKQRAGFKQDKNRVDVKSVIRDFIPPIIIKSLKGK